MRAFSGFLLAALLPGAFACGGSPDAPPPPPGGLKILAGADRSDTLLATSPQGLVVEVRDQQGHPVAGTAVDFESPTVAGWPAGAQVASPWEMLLGPVDSMVWKSAVATTTDDQGRAVVRVQMGTRAGPARVAIVVPLYGLTDTARYTVQAGAAVRVLVLPADTALELPGTFSLRATAIDRGGNPRPQELSYAATNGALSVDAGGDVTAAAIGRAYVRVSAAGLPLDSAAISVVPQAKLLVQQYSGALYSESMSGADQRQLSPGPTDAAEWSSAGDRVAYASAAKLFLADTMGSATGIPTGSIAAYWPVWSPGDDWIYFYGGSGENFIYRVHPDGSALGLVPGTASGWSPTPSPDGKRLAYVSDSNITIVDLATGTASTMPGVTDCMVMRWSPDGQWLACLRRGEQEVVLLSPAGSASRTLTAPALSGGLSWSPDSRWIVTGGFPAMLIAVDGTIVVPLPFGAWAIDWRH